MDSKGSENVHYKYSRDELLTISKLDLSLKKPEILRDECFNENKRWSPEMGFKAMLLESRHSNGNSSIKTDIKSEIKVDSSLPPLRPQLGGWGSGCMGMKPAIPTSQPPAPKETSPVRPVSRPAKIIIPPRPQEDHSTQLGQSWRDKGRFDFEKDRRNDGRRPAWNEKPLVNRKDERFNHRSDRYEPRYPSNRNGNYHPDDYNDETFGNNDDPWDAPHDEPFEFEGLPGDNRSDSQNQKTPESSTPPAVDRPPSQPNIPRSESPDMESRMMSELLKIFDDSEVTEIPVVTNPGGSRILGLLSHQDQYQPTSSYNDHMARGSNDYSHPDLHHQFHNRSMDSPRASHFMHGQQHQQQSETGGAVGNDLLQILQKAKINVNNLVPNSSGGGGVPSLNVAQAKSLAEIESDYQARAGIGRSSPAEPPQHSQHASENHAFNKLLEMMNSSRTRTEINHQQQQHHMPQQRLSSFELERLHEEKKRMEQQQQMAQESRRDSLGSTPHSFVPIQVMRQARSHFQEQVPRPVVGRTPSTGSGSAYPGQPGGNPFAPRMGLSDVEIRHLAQFRSPMGPGARPGVGRNSPVNLLPQQQQQFMVPPQMRGSYGAGGLMNQQHFGPPGGGMGLRPSQLPLGPPGQPRGGGMPPHQQFQSGRAPGPPQQPPTSQSQGPMNLQQLQMLNQHLHSLPPHQLSEMSRGMTSEQLNQMLLRASHQ